MPTAKVKRNDNLGTIKYINKVGVELEGAWQRFDESGSSVRTRCPRGWKEDGSVDVYTHENDYGECGWSGEIASHPIEPKAQVLGQWIKRNYPDKVNTSCGLHVHLSLINNNDYSKLVQEKFCKWMNQSLYDFGKAFKLNSGHALWSRIEGGGNYCRNNYRGEDQIMFATEDRYTQINFCAWHAHGTVEIRTLPAFRDSHVAVGAVYAVIKSVESYLSLEDELIQKGESTIIPSVSIPCEVDFEPTDPVKLYQDCGGGLVESVKEVFDIDQLDFIFNPEDQKQNQRNDPGSDLGSWSYAPTHWTDELDSLISEGE